MGSMTRRFSKQQKINTVKEFYALSLDEQKARLIRNGITQKDLDQMYEKGFKDGYKIAGENAIQSIYAGCAKVLSDAGNPKDDVLDFLKSVDDFVLASLGSEDDLKQLLDEYGIELEFKETLERVQQK